MIPVYEPEIGQDEIDAVVEVLRKGEISGSFSPTIEKFERDFAAYVGCKHGVAVASGTVALHLAVATAGIKRGDEVLVSASTNIATALAAFHNGAIPIAVDAEPITWNLNLDLIEGLVTARTRCLVPVHLFGHPVDMDRAMAIANAHGLIVIEDCAEAHGATVRGRKVGSFGHMACFSFYANKIITTGEGGMVTTNDDSLAERLRLLRNLAFQKPRFFHEHAGFNFRMTGMQAGLGLAQLKKIERIVADKRRVAHLYNRHLGDLDALQTPAELAWARNVYWMYGVTVTPKSRITRDELAEHLTARGIDTRTFFFPMNRQPCFRSQEGFRQIDCPVAEALWRDGLYLPSSCRLAEQDIARVASALREVLG
jgi:perosamine synthetase